MAWLTFAAIVVACLTAITVTAIWASTRPSYRRPYRR